MCAFGAAQPITAPVVITSPGTYELTEDARGLTDVYGIKIECSDVVLDGQGHFLGGDLRDKSVGVYVNKYGGSITNVTVKNLKLEDWNSAVSYQYVKGQEGDRNEVTNLDIIDCLTGIHIEYSDVIQLVDNMIRDCSTAINIEQNSNMVTLTKNNVKDNGAGILVANTVDVSLSDNNVNSCDVYGIEVTDSSGFSMVKNSVSDNKYAALKIENSRDSTITDNNFSKTETGPVVVIGNGVTGADIYNNYFGSVENISVDEISSDITWNTTLEVGVNILGGPYMGGNYWGSAPGLEGYSDTVDDEDGFGIGDKPYEINSYNIDYLPLTNTEKNYPAPTPEPVEQVASIEAENQTVSDGNLTETNETEEVSEIPSDKILSENVTEAEIALPLTPVQNEYVDGESAFSALGSEVVRVKEEAGNNTSQIVNNDSVTNISPVKNGYLLFTGLTPGNQVILLTSAGTEVNLDKVLTSTLSVPVPADVSLYSSWKIMDDTRTIGAGTISRYPAADETVVINTIEPAAGSPENSGATILQLSNLTEPFEGSNVSPPVIESVNTTPTMVIPPVLTYLPKDAGAENSSGIESMVMVNTADGGLVPGYTITAYAGPGGAIFPEGTIEVMAEGNITFVMTPYEGHEVDYLLIDGSAVNATPEYQFINVTRDHTIIAGFD